MAQRELRRICDRVRERWAVLAVALVHRLGEVPVGESSVVIAVCSAHRAEAFQACRFAIDEVKRTLPVWKKEWYAGEIADEATWKVNAEAQQFHHPHNHHHPSQPEIGPQHAAPPVWVSTLNTAFCWACFALLVFVERSAGQGPCPWARHGFQMAPSDTAPPWLAAVCAAETHFHAFWEPGWGRDLRGRPPTALLTDFAAAFAAAAVVAPLAIPFVAALWALLMLLAPAPLLPRGVQSGCLNQWLMRPGYALCYLGHYWAAHARVVPTALCLLAHGAPAAWPTATAAPGSTGDRDDLQLMQFCVAQQPKGTACLRAALLFPTQSDAMRWAIAVEYAGFGPVGWLEVDAGELFSTLTAGKAVGLLCEPGATPPAPMELRRLLTAATPIPPSS